MSGTLVKVGPDTLNKVLAYTSHVFPTCCLFDFLIIAPLLGSLHTTRIHNVCEGTGFPVLLLVYHIIIRKTSRLLTIFSADIEIKPKSHLIHPSIPDQFSPPMAMLQQSTESRTCRFSPASI